MEHLETIRRRSYMRMACIILITMLVFATVVFEFVLSIAVRKNDKNNTNNGDGPRAGNEAVKQWLFFSLVIAMAICAVFSFPQTNTIVAKAIVEEKVGFSARQMISIKLIYLFFTVFLLKRIYRLLTKYDNSKYLKVWLLVVIPALAGIWIYVMPLVALVKYVYNEEKYIFDIGVCALAIYICIYYSVRIYRKESGRHRNTGETLKKYVREPKNLLDMALLAEAAGNVKMVKAYVGKMIFTGNIRLNVNQQDERTELIKCQMSEPSKFADSLIYTKLFDKEKVFYGGMENSIVGYETVRWVKNTDEFASLWKEGEHSRRLIKSRAKNEKKRITKQQLTLLLYLPIVSILLSVPMFSEAGFAVIIMNLAASILSLMLANQTKGPLVKRFELAMIPEVLTIICDMFFWKGWWQDGLEIVVVMHIPATIVMYIIYLIIIEAIDSSKQVYEGGYVENDNPYVSMLKHFSLFVKQCSPEEFRRISKTNEEYGINMLPYAYICGCHEKWLTLVKGYEGKQKADISAASSEKYEQVKQWFI